MKKLINFILFILLFLLTKEFIYIFYENWNSLILNILDEYEYLKFSILIATVSFLFSFIFLVLYFVYKKLNVIFKILSYSISLILGLIIVNLIYLQFTAEMNFNKILWNLIVVLLVSSILNFILLQILEKKLNVK
ncbi:Uncharacterised protein [Weeksella virosa]|nr:Uncharacterised protein [Weeksella virosa]